jgi:hypothetical protein
MMTPRHLELFIRDGRTAAQCRTETNWRLDDPFSIAIAGPEWSAFVADFGQAQAAEIAALTSERDEAVATLETQRATMQAEIDRLTALVPAPVANYMITPSVFVDRLEAASPGVIDRLWSSDTKEAGRLAVTLFTWSERIDCRPGGRLEGYLNLIVQMGLMDADSVVKVWV